MTKNEKIALVTSIAIGIAGLAFGLTINGVYFSRSGALIVVVGIVYGLQELPRRLANIDSWAREQAEDHKTEAIKILLSEGADRNMAEIAYKNATQIVLKEINESAQKKRKELVFIEGAILILGTLIWGFGDIINPVNCITS